MLTHKENLFTLQHGDYVSKLHVVIFVHLPNVGDLQPTAWTYRRAKILNLLN